jgi:hypothetical protein
LAQTPDVAYINTDTRQLAYVKARTFELLVPIFKGPLLSNYASLYNILLFLKKKMFWRACQRLCGLSLSGAELPGLRYHLSAIFRAKRAKYRARTACFNKVTAPSGAIVSNNKE